MTLEVASERSISSLTGCPRVITFNARLAHGPEAETLCRELRAETERGARDFVFDLSRVPDLHSDGIGFLIMCLTAVRRAGGRLYLAAPSNRVLYSLLIARLDTFIPVFDSVEAALASLSEMPMTAKQEQF